MEERRKKGRNAGKVGMWRNRSGERREWWRDKIGSKEGTCKWKDIWRKGGKGGEMKVKFNWRDGECKE